MRNPVLTVFADGVAACAPRSLCNELAPCSQKLVDAFGIPDHLVAAPIATSAPSCMYAQLQVLPHQMHVNAPS